jgi:hypothetical protein
MTQSEAPLQAAPTGAGTHPKRAGARAPELRPGRGAAIPHADPFAAIRAPSLARRILSILLAPFIALFNRRMEAALANLTALLEQFRDGTLPAPAPARPPARRQPAPRTKLPAPPVPAWLERLIALALSDQPPAPRDHAGTPRTRTPAAMRPAPRPAASRPAAPRSAEPRTRRTRGRTSRPHRPAAPRPVRSRRAAVTALSAMTARPSRPSSKTGRRGRGAHCAYFVTVTKLTRPRPISRPAPACRSSSGALRSAPHRPA